MKVPRSLHTPVNSTRCTPGFEVRVERNGLESWSLPWHAWLRGLADGVRVETAAYAAAGSRQTRLGAVAAPGTWLMRVRVAAACAQGPNP